VGTSVNFVEEQVNKDISTESAVHSREMDTRIGAGCCTKTALNRGIQNEKK